eukprot:12323-Heterococcus_DN1.PRE.1
MQRVNSTDLVVGCIAVWQTKIIVLNLEVDVGQDQLGLDVVPDHACHLIAVQIHNGVLDLDLDRRCCCSRAGDCIEQHTSKKMLGLKHTEIRMELENLQSLLMI